MTWSLSERTTHAFGLIITVAACAGGQPSAPSEWRTVVGQRYSVMFTDADSATARTIDQYIASELPRTESVLNHSRKDRFVVRVFANRAEMTTHWQSAWNQPGLQTACWMIAAGWKEELNILSPRVWHREACGHDGTNAVHVQLVLSHELIHVLHAEINAAYPRLQAIESWLPEGLAVYGSGQWNAEYKDLARQAARSLAPTSMQQLWASTSGYALAGSVMAFLATRRPSDATSVLARAPGWTEALQQFGFNERTLLAEWESWMSR